MIDSGRIYFLAVHSNQDDCKQAKDEENGNTFDKRHVALPTGEVLVLVAQAHVRVLTRDLYPVIA